MSKSESAGITVAERDLLTIPETARLYPHLGHPETLYRLCRSGQFPPAVQVGRRWVVSVPRLERFLHGEAGIVSARVSGAVSG